MLRASPPYGRSARGTQIAAGATGIDALVAVVAILAAAVAITVGLVLAGKPAKVAPIVKMTPVATYRKAA